MLTPKSSETLSLLVRLIGLKIETIHLIFYEHQGKMDESAAFLELSFADRTSLLLSPAADGESLKAERMNWCDPLENCVDEETQQFFEIHGRWKRQNVTSREPYRHLIDQEIMTIIPTEQSGDFIGVSLIVNGYRLTYSIVWSEGLVSCDLISQT